ncbi:hypothetical protein [[Haemophilus] ducreyi]|nr:hypothetical protein [[Haemophilus] ducreyi]
MLANLYQHLFALAIIAIPIVAGVCILFAGISPMIATIAMALSFIMVVSGAN